MDSMLKSKLPDDPHDILVVAPDAVQVAPADQEASDPIRDMMRRAPSEPPQEAVRPALEPYRGPPDFSAGAAVPPVDTTFRPTAVNNGRRSIGGQVLRAASALVLTACIGGAAVAWQHHGDAAQRLFAEWAPVFARSAAKPSEKTGLAPQPALAAAQVDAASASPPQPAPQAQAATEAAAPTAAAPPSEQQAPSIETMARDLANAGQQIEQLKTSIEQLKASQQQLLAMVSEKPAAPTAVRPKKPVQAAQPASPPRPVAALTPARRPMSPLPPPSYPPRQAMSAPPLPPAPAPYVPRHTEPLAPTTAETLDDPELTAVPRPPMPMR